MTSIEEVKAQLDKTRETARQLGEALKRQQEIIEKAKKSNG